jgi:RecG-like helicase
MQLVLLLHGQLTTEEKALALEKFSNGETQVLVTTTVGLCTLNQVDP